MGLVEVDFSLIPPNQGVWGRAGGETGQFSRTRTALEASKPHYIAHKFVKMCGYVLISVLLFF